MQDKGVKRSTTAWKPSQKQIDYIVDQENGPFFSINEALQAATPGATILVNSGLYVESLIVRVPNVTLIPATLSAKDNIIILGDESQPTIDINIERGSFFTAKNIKVTHSAKIESDILKHNMNSAVLTGTTVGTLGIDDLLGSEQDSRNWIASRYDLTSKNLICLVRVYSGSITFEVLKIY